MVIIYGYLVVILVILTLCYAITFLFVFFFKQKTAYEMRISDWSSDVCSSDLPRRRTISLELTCWTCLFHPFSIPLHPANPKRHVLLRRGGFYQTYVPGIRIRPVPKHRLIIIRFNVANCSI